MALPENDSSVGHSFGLEFDGIQIKSITEVSGLKMEQDVIEYKSNIASDGKYQVKKLPGRWKAGECTLTRPLTDRSRLRQVGEGQPARQDEGRPQGRGDHRLRLRGRSRSSATSSPRHGRRALKLSSLKAGDTSVMTEKLVLTYEKCEPEDA